MVESSSQGKEVKGVASGNRTPCGTVGEIRIMFGVAARSFAQVTGTGTPGCIVCTLAEAGFFAAGITNTKRQAAKHKCLLNINSAVGLISMPVHPTRWIGVYQPADG